MLTAVAERNRDLMLELPSASMPTRMAFELGDYDAAAKELAFSQCEMVATISGFHSRPAE